MSFQDLLVKWNKGVIRGAQTEFAAKLKLERATVARWASGTYAPSEDLRPKVAKELGVTVEQLMAHFPQRGGGAAAAEPIANIYPEWGMALEYIPVVGYVSAETFNCVFEDEETTPMEVLPVPLPRGTKAKALKVRGSCMEPAASDGDYVVVAAKAGYDDGSLIVAKLDGECTLKRVYTRGEKVLLVPDNKKYKRLEIKKEELEIVGVVIYTIRKQTPKKLLGE